MPDSDNDKTAAIDKVVGAFRARREQAKGGAEQKPAAESGEATPVVKLGGDATPDEAPTPKGGDSETPTKAFKVPPQVAAAGAAAADADDRDAAESAEASGESEASEADADSAATATVTTASGLVEETVVGEPTTAPEESDSTADAADTDDADTEEAAADRADIVEQDVDVAGANDADAAETTDADADSADEPDADESDRTPTEKMAVPAAAAAAAAATAKGASTADASEADTVKTQAQRPQAAKPTATAEPKPVPEQAKPKVIEPATAQKKGRGKLVAALVAVIVVIAALAIGLWYLFVGSSPETEVAEAAESYQSAMSDGDLGKLRDITCGEEKKHYESISDDAFAKAYQAQKDRNEFMKFDEVKAVSIDGDTARVGVDMYPSNDPSKTAPAQITLHKVGDDWKVCRQP